MGLQQSSSSFRTIDNAMVEEHIRKMESLRAEVATVSKENNFLRRRVNDLSEYSSILEEELKKEKIKSSEKDHDIAKYTELCCKLEKENESLLEQNNAVLFDSFNLPKQINSLKNLGQSFGQNEFEENHSEQAMKISPLIRLHKQLEDLRFEVNSTKSNLLKEINGQRSSINDSELNRLFQEHDQSNQTLIKQGIFVGEKNLQEMEQTYRFVCLKNNERKIEVMKGISKIESDLNILSEKLSNNASELIERIGPLLREHQNAFTTNFKGKSFVEDYQHERMIYKDLVTKLSNEVTYFRKVLPHGTPDEASKFKSDTYNINQNVFDNNDSKNNYKGWSFDLLDGKKS